MKFIFNFALSSLSTIIVVSLIFVSLNIVFAGQHEQEPVETIPSSETSEKTTSETPEKQPSTSEKSKEPKEKPKSEEKAKPGELHPKVAKNADKLVEKSAEKDITIQITEGFRTHERQDALYAQGRTQPGDIVTNARGGESYHNYGLAVDFAVESDGDVIWDIAYDGNDNGESDWYEVGEIAKDLGFTWGGDWGEFRDYPHIQMDFGVDIEDLQEGNHDIY